MQQIYIFFNFLISNLQYSLPHKHVNKGCQPIILRNCESENVSFGLEKSCRYIMVVSAGLHDRQGRTETPWGSWEMPFS